MGNQSPARKKAHGGVKSVRRHGPFLKRKAASSGGRICRLHTVIKKILF